MKEEGLEEDDDFDCSVYSNKLCDLERGIEKYGSIAEYRSSKVKPRIENFLEICLAVIGVYVAIGLISWLIKPFVVDEK